MSENSGFKFYPLTGEGLDLLKAYSSALEEFKSEDNALVEEFNTKRREYAEKRSAELEQIWKRMSALAGLDPNKTWRNPNYQIEERYVDGGFGAILFVPQDPNMAALLGRSDPEPVSDEAVPEGTTIN